MTGEARPQLPHMTSRHWSPATSVPVPGPGAAQTTPGAAHPLQSPLIGSPHQTAANCSCSYCSCAVWPPHIRATSSRRDSTVSGSPREPITDTEA